METTLTHTRNSLPEKSRIGIAAILHRRLADSIDRMMQAKQAHWNVKGPRFIALSSGIEDAVTADRLTQVSSGADMSLWFVEAQQQAEH